MIFNKNKQFQIGERLSFHDLFVGMRVFNQYGKLVTVLECDDIQNIFCKSEKSMGIYCLLKENYTPLYKAIKIEKKPKIKMIYKFIFSER